LQVPISIRFSKKCPRCGLHYPKKEKECRHCKDLSNREVDDLKIKTEEEHEGNANLGKVFTILAIILFVAMIVLS